MYRCPTCVSIVVDTTVSRCVVCGANFKRHPPAIIGAVQRGEGKMTSWDVKANADASKIYGQDDARAKPDIDLVAEHHHDSSGRTAAVDRS